jgi:hypothetical protein
MKTSRNPEILEFLFLESATNSGSQFLSISITLILIRITNNIILYLDANSFNETKYINTINTKKTDT